KSLLASRSPIQVGAELYGDTGIDSDTEIVLLMLETLRVAKLDNVTLDLGHVAIYRAIIDLAGLDSTSEQEVFDGLQRKASVDLTEILSVVPDARVRDRLQALSELHGDESVRATARERLQGDPAAVVAAIDELAAVARAVRARLPSVRIYFDLGELRGYHYHTGLLFAALVPEWGEPVANGGRYDRVGAVFGRARPATGFSTDLKALIALGRDEQTARPGAIL